MNNAFGIRSAANVYFKKEPRDLTIDESAILVGMLKGPSMYNPKGNPIDSKARRNVVLGQMLKNNFIEQEAFDQLKELPIKITSILLLIKKERPLISENIYVSF